jgi:hypothetical protein
VGLHPLRSGLKNVCGAHILEAASRCAVAKGQIDAEDENKAEFPSWGAAQGQIHNAVIFLCKGKTAIQREEIAEEIVSMVRAIARGDKPPIQADPLTERDQHEREVWAKNAADRLISGAMRISERLPLEEQTALLRQIAKIALWHLPNASTEARQIARTMDIEALKSPHPRDDRAPEL